MLVMLLVLVQIYFFSPESQQIWARVAVSLKIEFFTQYLLEELSWNCLDYTDSAAVFTVCLCREYWPKRCRFAFLIMQPREETQAHSMGLGYRGFWIESLLLTLKYSDADSKSWASPAGTFILFYDPSSLSWILGVSNRKSWTLGVLIKLQLN